MPGIWGSLVGMVVVVVDEVVVGRVDVVVMVDRVAFLIRLRRSTLDPDDCAHPHHRQQPDDFHARPRRVRPLNRARPCSHDF